MAKIVRGIFYIQEDKFIGPPYVIDFYHPTEANTVNFQKVLNKFGTVYARGPGLVVQRAVTEDMNLPRFSESPFGNR